MAALLAGPAGCASPAEPEVTEASGESALVSSDLDAHAIAAAIVKADVLPLLDAYLYEAALTVDGRAATYNGRDRGTTLDTRGVPRLDLRTARASAPSGERRWTREPAGRRPARGARCASSRLMKRFISRDEIGLAAQLSTGGYTCRP
jgi:hypothetical protein